MVQIVLGIFDILSVCRVNAFLTLDLGTKVSINILRLFFVFFKCKFTSLYKYVQMQSYVKIVSEKNALRKRGKFKSRIIATLRDKLVALKSQLYEESNGYLVVAHLI